MIGGRHAHCSIVHSKLKNLSFTLPEYCFNFPMIGGRQMATVTKAVTVAVNDRFDWFVAPPIRQSSIWRQHRICMSTVLAMHECWLLAENQDIQLQSWSSCCETMKRLKRRRLALREIKEGLALRSTHLLPLLTPFHSLTGGGKLKMNCHSDAHTPAS